MIYNLDPADSVFRYIDYRNSKGDLENTERMWLYDSPIDFMEDSLGQHFRDNEWHVYCHFQRQLKKGST